MGLDEGLYRIKLNSFTLINDTGRHDKLAVVVSRWTRDSGADHSAVSRVL